MFIYSVGLVPGDFVPSRNNHNTRDVTSQLQQLSNQVCLVLPTSTSQHGMLLSLVLCSLQAAKFIFVRRDGHRTLLQRPYTGPFKVLSPGPKTFQIDKCDKEETVSIDRLKSAHLEVHVDTPTASPSQKVC